MDKEERAYGLMTDIQKAQSFDKVQELILAYANEIRAEAAEKAKAAFNKWAMNRIITDEYKLVEGRTMIESEITSKEAKK